MPITIKYTKLRCKMDFDTGVVNSANLMDNNCSPNQNKTREVDYGVDLLEILLSERTQSSEWLDVSSSPEIFISGYIHQITFCIMQFA